MNGLSVQYAAATGTAWQVTNLTNVNLAAGQYYLIQEAAGANLTATSLPAPDATGIIAMAAGAGKVALVNNTVALNGACPAAPDTAATLDIVGYGTTGVNCTPAAPALTNTTSDTRTDRCMGGTQPWSAFTAGAVNPRNAATALNPCGAPAGISFTPATLPAATISTLYSQTFVASGGNGTYQYTLTTGSLPPGLALSTAGVLSGTPTTTAGSPYSFQITIADTASSSATQSYTLGVNNTFICGVTNTIAQIQGSGTASPLGGATVTTSGTVTALRSNGFHLQMPSPGDGDPNTSDAVFVFTSSAPSAAAAMGNSVCVSGTVQEFTPDAGYSTITEIATPTVTTLSTGNALPAPVVLTAADFAPNGGLFQREKYESMRVAISTLTVVAPSQGTVNEPNATATSNGTFFGVLPGLVRPFREPGVSAYDVLPAGTPATIPRWDTNPELLRVNTAQLTGSTAIDVTTGATLSNLSGVFDYKFGQYTLLADTTASPAISVTGNARFTAIPAPLSSDLTVGSFNLQHFYDTVDDPTVSDSVLTAVAFRNRLAKASMAIRNVIQMPDILALEEVENLATVQALAATIDTDAVLAGQTAPGYQSFLVPGNDIGGINNGFLVKSPKVTVVSVTQYGKTATFLDPTSNAQALLNDRPPLVLKATAKAPGSSQSLAVTVIANHLRSLISVNDPVDGARVRAKREAGAEFLANLVQSFQSAGEKVFVVGDLNAYQVNDGYVDVVGVIRGNPAPASEDVLPGIPNLVSPVLTDGVDLLPPGQRYSDTFDGTAQVLDHVLFTANAASLVRSVAYGRVNADFPEAYRGDATRPERVSDHDPVIAYVTLPTATGPVDVTASTAVSGSGLSYNRVSQVYSGTVTVTNTGSTAFAGPINVAFANLTTGVTLVNATGVYLGAPYFAASTAPLPAGASVTLPVQFKNTGTARIGYTVKTYSGAF